MMNDFPPRIFGRTDEPITPVWRQRADPSIIDAGDWLVLAVTPDVLDRRPHVAIEQRLSALGRPRADVLLLTDILSSELKIGWPMHRMQQLRDRRLCRYLAIETNEPLESEWIVNNAPIHAAIIHYTPADMAVRYRVFEAAKNAGVALLARATSPAESALQLGTPEICATILAPTHADAVAAASPEEVDRMWQAYQSQHAEPAKLRSGHPPDYGV